MKGKACSRHRGIYPFGQGTAGWWGSVPVLPICGAVATTRSAVRNVQRPKRGGAVPTATMYGYRVFGVTIEVRRHHEIAMSVPSGFCVKVPLAGGLHARSPACEPA